MACSTACTLRALPKVRHTALAEGERATTGTAHDICRQPWHGHVYAYV